MLTGPWVLGFPILVPVLKLRIPFNSVLWLDQKDTPLGIMERFIEHRERYCWRCYYYCV